MGRIKLALLVILAAAAMTAFFLPWVRVQSTETFGMISQIFTGKQYGVAQDLSAHRITVIANSKESSLVVSLAEIFFPNVKDADKKTYLLWIIPLLAVAIALGGIFFGANKWFNLVVGIIAIAAFTFVTIKIKSADLDKIVMKVSTAPGLWLTLWAYLGIGLVCLGDLIMGRRLWRH